MMTKKIPTAHDAGSGHSESKQHGISRRPERKWRRVLAALASGQSFNRFEAERTLHDHCLPSTIAKLQSRGVTIQRHTERVPGYQGIPTDCARYWLDAAGMEAARRLLGEKFGSDCQIVASGHEFAREV
jgi:hypothetical protein